MIKHGLSIIRYLRPPTISGLSFLKLSRLYSVHKIGLNIGHSPKLPQPLLRPPIVTLSSDNDADLEPSLTEVDEICDTSVENIREILYKESCSELEILNNVQSLDELMIALRNFEDLHFEQVPIICQTILVLWDLIRTTFLADVTCKEELTGTKKHELDINCDQILKSEEVRKVFMSLERHVTKLTPDELGCCLMYLNKIGLAIEDPLQQKIIDEFLRYARDESEINLSALSRFLVTISPTEGVYKLFTSLEVMPHVYRHLDNCTKIEELCLVTIALNHIAKIVPLKVMQRYEQKVRELIDNGNLKCTAPRIILKVLNLLNYPEWSAQYQLLTRDLMLLMEPVIENLAVRELYLVQKNLKNRLEPANIVPKIVKRADHLLKTETSAELLICSLLESLPEKRVRYTVMTNQLIRDIDLESDTALPLYFKVLRLLKTSNLELCNLYWDKVNEDLQKNLTDPFKLVRYLHRYMHFNNNLGGTYRHRPLENTIMTQLFNEIENGMTAMIPSAFSRAVAFIIGYGSHLLTEDTIPELIIDKVEEIAGQFNIQDCLKLSRGVQIAHELRYKFYIPKKEAPHLVRIEEVLNKCAAQHITSPTLNIIDLNTIVKAYNARKSSRKSSLFQEMISKYDTIDGQFNSRVLREVTFNLVTSNYSCVPMFERLIDYTVKNYDFISGDTLEKIVVSFYTLGFIPENEEFFKACHHIIERDFNYMPGLSIIHSGLALCFFKALSEDLIHKVFNISFIKRLEDEIEACYSKETYPEKVLNNVMQLNRAVCLDVPAANVPWFQQNYIEAQMSKGEKYFFNKRF